MQKKTDRLEAVSSRQRRYGRRDLLFLSLLGLGLVISASAISTAFESASWLLAAN